jgi:hypothetical protein
LDTDVLAVASCLSATHSDWLCSTSWSKNSGRWLFMDLHITELAFGKTSTWNSVNKKVYNTRQGFSCRKIDWNFQSTRGRRHACLWECLQSDSCYVNLYSHMLEGVKVDRGFRFNSQKVTSNFLLIAIHVYHRYLLTQHIIYYIWIYRVS